MRLSRPRVDRDRELEKGTEAHGFGRVTSGASNSDESDLGDFGPIYSFTGAQRFTVLKSVGTDIRTDHR